MLMDMCSARALRVLAPSQYEVAFDLRERETHERKTPIEKVRIHLDEAMNMRNAELTAWWAGYFVAALTEELLTW